MTQDNRDKFSYLIGRYNQLAEFKSLIPGVEKMSFTIGVLYKLLIPQILPNKIKKVLFLDPDTIVNLDISELWNVDLEDKILGAVTEKSNGANPTKSFFLCSEGVVKPDDYFNGGVLLMNLELLRGEEDSVMKGIEFRGKNSKHKFLDQTVLNYCFAAQV